VTVAADGGVWFTDQDSKTNAAYVGEVTPAGKVIEHSVPGPKGQLVRPWSLTQGADGRLYLSATYLTRAGSKGYHLEGSAIVAITTTNGALHAYTVSSGAGTYPVTTELTGGPGTSVWFLVSNTEHGLIGELR
jgi:hypothetical protein